MFKQMLRNYDKSLIISVLSLCMIGLVMVYSSSYYTAMVRYGESSSYFFTRQLLFFGVSLVVFLLALLAPYKVYKKLMKIMLLFSLFLLTAVLLFGRTANNAQSWISFGSVGFQPAEFVKLGLIIYLAAIYSKKQSYLSDFVRGVLPTLVVIVTIFCLVAIQPDLGTAMLIVGTSGVMIICSGIRLKHLILLFLLAMASCTILGIFLSEEQLSRFTAAYDPFSDPQGSGYHLINSYIAIAHGGIIGQGLGGSTQKLGFLPEAHTDFISAIIAEEFGFFGIGIVISLLAYIVFRGFFIAIRCKDTFGSLLVIGICGMIGIQSIVNLGAATGLLPITGVPLPFISYGGSSLLLLMMAMGIVINISSFVNMERKKPDMIQKNSSDRSLKLVKNQNKRRAVSRLP
ncbi:putative lipid II flippase FtsW [Bacillus taeanensis]|uniref:Probable peptidoglycan glycosyltransferase FtsW n=1 Tax=Bacillus taeanensis TaxID=273032 RepID=A0A366XQ29_9BACI|nr:putative lipid II flippase FtsW [Bacillus taeanensis]RBW68470.1 putative lipid II flippase FtsW [Bacillus taeanensis]